MKKQNFLKLFVMLLCFSPLSHAYVDMKPWYISAFGGTFAGNFDVQYNDETDIIPQDIRQFVQQHGYIGGLALGYTYFCPTAYALGGEITAYFMSGHGHYNSGAATAAFHDTLRIKYDVDLSFVPGVYLNNYVLMYGKLGVGFANIYAKIHTPTGFVPTFINIKNNRHKVVGVFGLGIKTMINPSMAIFFEYVFHEYGMVHFKDFQNFNAIYSHSAHVYSQSVMAGASYLF